MTGKGGVIRAFSEEDVERLTRISRSQLRYWDRTRFFTPSLADDDRRRPYSRTYSFRDVINLQVLNVMRNESRVPLQHLREVKDKLAHLGDDLWGKTILFVLNRRVVFFNEETDRREDVVSGQGVLEIPLRVVRRDMENAVRLLWKRDSATIGQVQRKRGVVSKNPVIAGTRIPVDAIKEFHRVGYTINQILDEYPTLTEDDIRAALEYGKAA
jgi:uncharacterized protein (DUF433 family)/DNA-binding transcriptional MerR regulator